jgi:uncharacterized protein with FMN-binding domain
MKKIIVAAVLVIALGGYWWWSSRTDGSAVIAGSNPPATTVPQTTPTGSSTPPTTPQQTGQYKDGTYTGSIANSVYGNVQVAAVVSGGRLSDVQFITFPNSTPHSIQVSGSALPALKTEAIASQSAQVNVVSGATQTSEAFQQSLGSALVQAQS